MNPPSPDFRQDPASAPTPFSGVTLESLYQSLLRLDDLGSRASTLKKVLYLKTKEALPNILPPRFLFSTSCTYLSIEQETYKLNGFPKASFSYQDVIIYSAVAHSCYSGSEREVLLVAPGTKLVNYRPLGPGQYVYEARSKVLARSSFNLVRIPDSQEIHLMSKLLDSNPLTYWYWYSRLYVYTRESCCAPKRNYGYVDERLYAALVANRCQFLKEPLSESVLRVYGNTATKMCTVDGNVVVPDLVLRSTVICFALLANVTLESVSLDEHPTVKMSLKTELAERFGEEVYVTSKAPFLFSEDPLMISQPPDNGNIIPKTNPENTLGYDPLKGLWFRDEYSASRPLYILGPAILSQTIKYDVNSTKSASMAFQRLTKALEGQSVYRANQDSILANLFPRHSQTVNINRRYNFLIKDDPWGLNYQQAKEHRERNRSIDLTSKCVSLLASLFRTHLKQVISDNNLDFLAIYKLPQQQREAYADEKHPKRSLRLSVIAQSYKDPNLFEVPLRTVKAKVKNETAKSGKLPRQFIALGDNAVLQNPETPRMLKEAFSHEFIYEEDDQTHSFKFIKTGLINGISTLFESIALFHSHINESSQNNLYLDHSDDSCVHFTCSIGGIQHGVSLDMDISSCDLSHGPGIFASFWFLANHLGFDVTDLLDQFNTPIVISHPNKNSKDSLTLKSRFPVMLTGSTLTTIINTWACHLLLFAFQDVVGNIKEQGVADESQLKNLFIQKASELGYKITVDCVVTPLESLEFRLPRYKFLMFFPVREVGSGTVVALPCLGRLLRNLGWTDEEKLTRNPVDNYRNVIRTFLSSHTSTWHDLVSRLVLKIPHKDLPLIESEFLDPDHLNHEPLSVRREVRLEDICYRYDIDSTQFLLDTEFFFRDLQPRILKLKTFARILYVDYGIEELDEGTLFPRRQPSLLTYDPP